MDTQPTKLQSFFRKTFFIRISERYELIIPLFGLPRLLDFKKRPNINKGQNNDRT